MRRAAAHKTSEARLLRCSARVRWLRPLFSELKSVIEQFVDWHHDPAKGDTGEPPYWNNETASISMLAAAAARQNYIALADYRSEKVRERKSVRGRCDLYLARESKWLEIEAKQAFLTPRSGVQRIEDALDAAMDDAKCIPRGEPRAALVFAVMNIPLKQGGLKWDSSRYVDLFESVEADLSWVWYDTNADDRYQWEGESRLYPGVAVFLRYVP